MGSIIIELEQRIWEYRKINYVRPDVLIITYDEFLELKSEATIPGFGYRELTEEEEKLLKEGKFIGYFCGIPLQIKDEDS